MDVDSMASEEDFQLYEPYHPRYPRRQILLHLVSLFLKHFQAHCFPWLDSSELLSDAASGRLPAVLANSICACSAPFSKCYELNRFKKGKSPFADTAKSLIAPMLSWPSMEVIESLVIICYSEFAAGGGAGLWMYCGMALRMATDSGFQYEETLSHMATQKQRDRARLLFWAVVSLDRITSYATGRPTSMREDSIHCQLPPLQRKASEPFIFGHIARILLQRGRVNGILTDKTDLGKNKKAFHLYKMWVELSDYCRNLPRCLQFGITNLRHFFARDQGAAFVYLHMLIQSTISLFNRPSLFSHSDQEIWRFAPLELVNIGEYASGAIVSILNLVQDAREHIDDDNVGAKNNGDDSLLNACIDCNPFLDQLVLHAGRTLLTMRETHLRLEKLLLQPRAEESEEQSSDSALRDIQQRKEAVHSSLVACQKILDRLSVWWNGALYSAETLRCETLLGLGDIIKPDRPQGDDRAMAAYRSESITKWLRGCEEATIPSVLHGVTFPVGSITPTEVQMDHFNSVHERSVKLDICAWNRNVPSAIDEPAGASFNDNVYGTSEADMQALFDAWTDESIFNDIPNTKISPCPHQQCIRI